MLSLSLYFSLLSFYGSHFYALFSKSDYLLFYLNWEQFRRPLRVWHIKDVCVLFCFVFNTSVAIQIKPNWATIFWEGKQEKSKRKCSKKLSFYLLLWTLYIGVLHHKTTLPPNTHNYAQSLLRTIGKEENHFSMYWYSKNLKVKEIKLL